jgi:hypothetical protein
VSATSFIFAVLFTAVTATGSFALLRKLFGQSGATVPHLAMIAIGSGLVGFFSLFTLAFLVTNSEAALWAYAVIFGAVLASIAAGVANFRKSDR